MCECGATTEIARVSMSIWLKTWYVHVKCRLFLEQTFSVFAIGAREGQSLCPGHAISWLLEAS